MIKKAIVLFMHEEFIYRKLRKNGFILRDGSQLYCKESIKLWRMLDKVCDEINKTLAVCPEAGRVFMYPETWENYL